MSNEVQKELDSKVLTIIVSAMRSKLDYQLNADTALDSKISTLLGFLGTVSVFYLGIIDKIFMLFALVPLVLIAISGVKLMKAVRIKDYYTGVFDASEGSDELKKYSSFDECNLLDQLKKDYQTAFDINHKVTLEKAYLYSSSLNYFIVAIVSIVVFYIFSL